MIKRLQKLKARRGFTMIELIVVIAIIAVMSATVIVGLNTNKSKIEEANTAAADFYTAIQAEFTNFQMFDGPLTMTLNKAYNDNIFNLGTNSDNGGIKYYPWAGGNYPFSGLVVGGETHANGKPKAAAVFVEICARGGMLRHVNYANELETLLTMKGAIGSGNTNAQLCLVLANEMKDRMEYRDGYYYARISYTPPTWDAGHPPSGYDFRNVSVHVSWAAFSKDELTEDEATYTFGRNNVSLDGHIVGVHADAEHRLLGNKGTHLWNTG